jgi:hypothetical protein
VTTFRPAEPDTDGISRRSLLRRAAWGAGAVAAGGLLAGPASAGSFGPATAAALPAQGLRFARVRPTSVRQLAALAAFDETHAVLPDGSMELLLWPGDEKRLKATGVDYQVFAPREDVAARSTGLAPQPGERSAYRLYADYGNDLAALAARFPEQARLVILPEKSLEGRTAYGIEIADDVEAAQTDGRPTFWVDGAHHSREWPSSEYSIMFAYDLLESFGRDDRVSSLLQQIKVVVVPVVNPDGFVTSREAVYATTPADQDTPWAVTGTMTGWRKNRRSFTGALYGPANTRSELNLDAHGVDPNRNYPFYWGGEGGGGDPTSQTYGGATPFSEPEARNIASLMKGQQVTAYLTNHTYGRLCMRPWGYTNHASPDSAFQEDLGRQMCEFTKYRNQIGLSLYPTAGTSRDWSYGALRTIVYTFEHGGTFHPAYASTVPQTYALNRPAWLLLAEAAADVRNHGVVEGRAVDADGAPVAGAEVVLTKTFRTPTAAQFEKSSNYSAYRTKSTDGIEETIRSVARTRSDGSFVVHANPSTRPTVVQDGRESERWTFAVVDGGRSSAEQTLLLERGTRARVGDVVLS